MQLLMHKRLFILHLFPKLNIILSQKSLEERNVSYVIVIEINKELQIVSYFKNMKHY